MFASVERRTREALECCEIFAEMLSNALAGHSKQKVLSIGAAQPTMPLVAALAAGEYVNKTEAKITSSGHCVASLEAALWCFSRSTDFEETVLMATNLGGDSDTTAAIAGQLAGAFYGIDGIPPAWMSRLYMREEIERLAQELFWRTRGNVST
jgi:ADP-ribosyl-[dinitrogen reductase] hydrolase